MTTAAIDRVIHYSTVLELNIENYRMEVAKRTMKEEEQFQGYLYYDSLSRHARKSNKPRILSAVRNGIFFALR